MLIHLRLAQAMPRSLLDVLPATLRWLSGVKSARYVRLVLISKIP